MTLFNKKKKKKRLLFPWQCQLSRRHVLCGSVVFMLAWITFLISHHYQLTQQRHTATTTTTTTTGIITSKTAKKDLNQRQQQPKSTTTTTTATSVSKIKIKIACVGDSLTRGDIGNNVTYGIDDYPTQLQQLLLDSNDKPFVFKVRNFGVNGATALSTVNSAYTHTKEYKQIFNYKPNIILFCLGTNDVKYLRNVELRQQYTRQIINSFVSLVQEFYNKIDDDTLHTIYFVYRVPYIAKDFQRIKQVNVELYLHPIVDVVVENITKWVEKQNVIHQNQPNRKLIFQTVNLMDVTKQKQEANINSIYINDGLHFNHEGYKVIAQTWYDHIIL